MSKYRSYKISLRRKKSSKVLRIGRIIALLAVIVLAGKYFKLVTMKIKDIFSIKEVIILKNNTTVPDDVLLNNFSTPMTVLTYTKTLSNIKKMYPEIKQLKVLGIPFQKLKLEVISEIPIYYTKVKEQTKFFSKTIGWYSVYDVSLVSLKNLIELENRIEDKNILFLTDKIVRKICCSKLKGEIIKIIVGENGEWNLIIRKEDGQSQLLVDENIIDIDEEDLHFIISHMNRFAGKIYARLITEGRIYVEENEQKLYN
ncbi:MAG: hypothetical protein RMJ13_01625 [Elusimicrobiota bacterium]|nr:hypothetical protein [Endomicrobiia bacterium]MDW8055398.1 hypothetical protein [Elusimicrobiota bacterium]